MRLAAALALLLVAPFAGCLSQDTGPRSYAGTADGYEPTNAFLKLTVKDEHGDPVLFDFDRRDWYTAELARRVDTKQVTAIVIEGQPRQTLGEVLTVDVVNPANLSGLRYDHMNATAQDRASMDSEYDALLRSLAPAAPTVAAPTAALPVAVPTAAP